MPTVPPKRTLAERNVELVRRLEEESRADYSRLDACADSVTAFCGSYTFVWVHVVWFVVWILLNTVCPKHYHFDPFPFQFLTLTVSLEAIFLATFVLISQNRQAALTEKRASLSLQVSMLGEDESDVTVEMLSALLDHLGVQYRRDEDEHITVQLSQLIQDSQVATPTQSPEQGIIGTEGENS